MALSCTQYSLAGLEKNNIKGIEWSIKNRYYLRMVVA